MRLRSPVLVGLLAMLMSAPVVLRGVMIDRIAVAVGNQAITENQITQEINLAALLNGKEPVAGNAERQAAAGRLIEQALIRREMTFGSYPAIPEAAVDSGFASTEKARGGAAALSKLLQSHDLTTADLRDYLKWQLALLQFIDLRFRPAVQVSNEDVEKYYREHNAVAKGKNVPSLQQLRDQIQEKLTGERVDAQVDEWMKRARARTVVRYLDPSLGASPAAPLEPATVQPH